jgi:hypothetical protein
MKLKIFSSDILTDTHREGLIKMYNSQLEGEGKFMTSVLQLALRELKRGVKPRKVEDFVVKMEKIFKNGL